MMIRGNCFVDNSGDLCLGTIFRSMTITSRMVDIIFPESWLWTFREETHYLLVKILCKFFSVRLAFLFYDILVLPLSPWRVTWIYIYEMITWHYISKMLLSNLQLLVPGLLVLIRALPALCYITLRYVDEDMDLLSMLTRMLAGQSLDISPNKWHSLCTPPVCRNTRPNDLRKNQQNYQIQHTLLFR